MPEPLEAAPMSAVKDATSIRSCLRGCGADLAACADPVINAGWDCARACRQDPDRLGCLRLCVTTAAVDAVACFEDFELCLMATCPEP